MFAPKRELNCGLSLLCGLSVSPPLLSGSRPASIHQRQVTRPHHPTLLGNMQADFSQFSCSTRCRCRTMPVLEGGGGFFRFNRTFWLRDFYNSILFFRNHPSTPTLCSLLLLVSVSFLWAELRYYIDVCFCSAISNLLGKIKWPWDINKL